MTEQKKGSKTYLMGITFVAIIGGLLFGYDTAVISGAEQALQLFFRSAKDFVYTDALHGMTASSALIGCVIGGALSGVLSKKLGRKNSLILAAVLFFLSALGSFNPEFLFFKHGVACKGVLVAFTCYRILGGIGVGLASAVCPMYIAEVAPAEKRGTLVSMNQFAIIFGMLVVYFVNYFIKSHLSDAGVEMVSIGWRRMFLSEAYPAAAFGLLLLTVPRTPRFLCMGGHDDKALKVLTRINGSERAASIIKDIRKTTDIKKDKLFSFGYKVVVVGMLLSFFQQAIGINVVLYYAPRIFQNMGASGNTAMLQTVVMGIVNIIFTLVAVFTVDRLGRKPLLIIGSAGMLVGMVALAMLSFSDKIGIAALVFIIIYTASFMMSWGPVCWVLISEIFPNTIRSQAVAIAVAVQWIANYAVSSTFLPLSCWSVGGTYLIYAVFCVLSILFVWKMVPETKGKTLEDMNDIWSK
ncbi:MAG: D-xylose transporter XylE [Bacteroidales bacterium]|jgi:SP family xylose:H+ symportor-like MFS transporter|nr:D-xylose transporter XylE [Bacteroidales bacterium]